MRNLILVLCLISLLPSCTAGAVVGGIAGAGYMAGCVHRGWWPCEQKAKEPEK